MSAATSCIACPTNTFSPARSFNVTFCDCNQGYTGPDGTACVSCNLTNTYKPTRGSAPCGDCTKQVCDTGFFRPMCNITTDGVCQRCSNAPDFAVYTGPGLPYFQENCSWECDSTGGYVPSPIHGTFCSIRGRDRVCFTHLTTCVKCDTNCSKGSFSKDCSCHACSAGGSWPPVNAEYSALWHMDGMPACSWQCRSGLSSTRCHGPGNGLCRLPCPEGTHGDANEECTACPAGKSSPAPSAANFSVLNSSNDSTPEGCTLCGLGKYKPELGIVRCETRETSSIDECVFLGTCPDRCPSACVRLDDTLSICCRAFIDAEHDSCQSLACLSCPMNTYADTVGAARCDHCPSNAISGTGSTNITDCKCSPGFEGPDGGSCTMCSAGKFKRDAGAEGGTCANCEAGTFASEDGATACVLCDSGTISVAGSTSCTAEQVQVEVSLILAMNASYFQEVQSEYAEIVADVAGVPLSSVLVSAILNGSSAASNRRLLASVEPGIKVLWDINSPRFHVPVLKASITTALRARLVEIGPLPILENLKENCGTGREPDGFACAMCGIGKFKRKADNSSCLSCSNSTTTAGVGSIFASDCVCVAGYFLNYSSCSPCPPGTFKPFGPGACMPCAKGSYSPGTLPHWPAVTCQYCPVEAYRSPTGSDAKEDCCPEGCICDAGFNELGDDSKHPFQCVGCEAGFFKPAVGTSPCSLCGKGRYTNATSAATSCHACPPDTYNSLSDGTSCKECPPFTSTDAEGGSSIMDCKCEFSPQLRCAGCPAGEYGLVDDDRQIVTKIQVHGEENIYGPVYRIDAMDMRFPLPGNQAVALVTYNSQSIFYNLPVVARTGVALINVSNGAIAPVTYGERGGYADGPPHLARFNWGFPALAVSPDRSFALVADYSNHVIRKVDLQSGNVSTFAGCCQGFSWGQSGNGDGNTSFAIFGTPRGIVFSSDGARVYISDDKGVRKIDMESLVVSTIFQSGDPEWNLCGGPRQLAIKPDDSALVFMSTVFCVLDLSTNAVTPLAGGGSRGSACDNGRCGAR